MPQTLNSCRCVELGVAVFVSPFGFGMRDAAYPGRFLQCVWLHRLMYGIFVLVPVRVVTDSTADLPRDVVASLGVAVVPLHVYFGAEEYEDGVSIGGNEFYRRLATSGQVPPRTAAPAAGTFEALYQRLAEESDGIVSIHISPRLSGTYAAAVAASSRVQRRCPTAVIDSATTCLGLGLLVVQAATMARDGASVDEIAAETRDAVKRTRFFGAVGTLEYLRRGGRIGRAASFLGSVLHILPIIGLYAGEVYPIERVRGRQRALERICEIVAEYGRPSLFAVGHTTDETGMNALAERLSPLFPAERMLRAQCGATLGTYLGPGAVGVALIQALP